jgi:anti-anti-sigma factor
VRNVELRTGVCGSYPIVMLRGELDTSDAEDTAAAVAVLAAGGQQLIIDLETLNFIDCHAAGALLTVRETARQAGGDVLLAAPHGLVLRLLTILGVPGVYASVAAAADSADSRDARRSAVSIAPSGMAVHSGTWYRMMAWRAAVPGVHPGNRSWSPRWLRARTGPRG